MGRTCTQLSVNGDLTIPQHKPDIESILRITTTPIIEKTIPIHKKVIFIGHVRICVEYVACVPECTQPIHFVSFVVPFNGLICHRFVRPNLKVFLKTKILFQELQIIDPRSIKKVIALKIGIHKFSRSGKCLSAHYSGPCHITVCEPDKSTCSSISQSCCNEPHHSCEDVSPHHNFKHKPHHHSCKHEAAHHSCKNEELHHSCKDEPPHHSSNSKLYHSTYSNELSQYGDFYLPTSVQPLTNRGTTTSGNYDKSCT